MGIFDVLLNAGTIDTVDSYSASLNTAAQKSYPVTPGLYTLSVRPTGNKNASSFYYWTLLGDFGVE